MTKTRTHFSTNCAAAVLRKGVICGSIIEAYITRTNSSQQLLNSRRPDQMGWMAPALGVAAPKWCCHAARAWSHHDGNHDRWATVLEGLNADRAALAEIDENLARADLSPAERAAHQHARKELYERLHPQTRKGSAGGRAKSAKSQGAKYQVDTWHPAYIAYIDDAAKKSGRSRASISRETNRSKSIPDVAGTSLDKGTELDALGRLPSDVREQLAAEAKAGKKVSAKATLTKVQRAQKEIDLGFKQAALPQKSYGVIVADPEWCFEPWSQETGMDRAADNHYKTITVDEIKAFGTQYATGGQRLHACGRPLCRTGSR